MQCYARWEKDNNAGVFFRDQTILQFGNCWDLLANLVLLNPGSALPIDNEPKTDYLRSKALSFFVEPQSNEKYVEFHIDPLMKNVLKLFASHFDGGMDFPDFARHLKELKCNSTRGVYEQRQTIYRRV